MDLLLDSATWDLSTDATDLLLVDGNGILHPRRIGMASQLGIALEVDI